MNRRARARILAVLMAGVLVTTLVGGLLASTSNRTDSGSDQTADTTALVDDLPPTEQRSDLPPINFTDLPPEALETLTLVAQGGPFPNARDGATFFNREGLLPAEAEGYYLEYTVPTPGESDRGPRRVVVGGDELDVIYYTDDHYESFSEVVLA